MEFSGVRSFWNSQMEKGQNTTQKDLLKDNTSLLQLIVKSLHTVQCWYGYKWQLQKHPPLLLLSIRPSFPASTAYLLPADKKGKTIRNKTVQVWTEEAIAPLWYDCFECTDQNMFRDDFTHESINQSWGIYIISDIIHLQMLNN